LKSSKRIGAKVNRRKKNVRKNPFQVILGTKSANAAQICPIRIAAINSFRKGQDSTEVSIKKSSNMM
jgi:hypothetical protein